MIKICVFNLTSTSYSSIKYHEFFHHVIRRNNRKLHFRNTVSGKGFFNSIMPIERIAQSTNGFHHFNIDIKVTSTNLLNSIPPFLKPVYQNGPTKPKNRGQYEFVIHPLNPPAKSGISSAANP